MATSGVAATVFGARLGLMATKGHLRETAWKKMVLFASCVWFCITSSLAFFITFLAMRVFRSGRGEESCKKGCFSSAPVRPLVPIDGAGESEVDEEGGAADEEKEASVFQFRFSFQIPEPSDNSMGVQGAATAKDVVSPTTSISNYRFFSETDYRGFMEAPQAMTLCVQESYMGTDGMIRGNTEGLDRELKSRFSSLKCTPPINSDIGDAEELDRELKSRFSSVRFSQRNDLDDGATEKLDRELKSRLSSVKSCSGKVDSDVGVSEELDRELMSRFLSVKLSLQHDSDDRVAVAEEEQEHNSTYADNLVRTDDPEGLEGLDVRVPDEADVPVGAWSLPAAGFKGFDSDAESETTSDGYSVKDLGLDFDTDGCFSSESDFEPEIGKASSLDLGGESELLEREQKSEATQLPSSLGSARSSEDFDGENIELLDNTENFLEINLENMNSSSLGLCYTDSIGSLDLHDVVLPDGDVRAEEHEFKQVHAEAMDQREAIDDSDYTGGPSSISSSVGLDSEYSVIIQSGRILGEAGRGGSECFQLEESESSESRRLEGNQLLNSCDVDEESGDFGNNNHNNSSKLSDQNLSAQGPESSPKSRNVGGEEAGAAAEAGLSGAAHSQDDAALLGENSNEEERGRQEPQNLEETRISEKSKELSMEEMEELESFGEHQDLLEQLKMELRKARTMRLPTILEESESPRSAEDLKPWKVDAQFLHDSPMDELHKLHKTYRERMRKLDVLNYQKMYAIGFLQLRDPLQSMGTHKPFIPTIASILSQNFWPCHRQKSSIDPSEKFIKEIQSDLETVYVAQSCLSWEFLHWQYERTRELLGSDLYDNHQYNQVAGEFQQFQVLIQRFLENEPFQGPRVPNYVKKRCVLRSLLQVPIIREDCLKDLADERGKRKDAITGEQLEYIMEDSIRIFWEFVKSEKDETPLIMKGLVGTHVELQDPTDLELMVDIQAILKQKQKKLKDILRTGNCVVKKFKKARQGRSNQDDVFFSQVDMKLVSRVLKMTRITTDQLVWCHEKLSKITFLDRKLLREPTFLLFPC